MNRNDLFNSFQDIDNDILERSESAAVKKEKPARRRWLPAAACGLGLAAILAIGIFGPWHPAVDVPGNTTEGVSVEATAAPKRATLTFVSSADGKMERTEVTSGVRVPASMFIRVRDVSDVAEEDLFEIKAEEQAKNQELRESGHWITGGTMYGGDRAIISIVRNGALNVEVEDPTQVAKYQIETSGAIRASALWNEYPAVYPIPEGQQKDFRTGLRIHWDLSYETLFMLKNDPATPLSVLRGTVTVTLEYKDGSREAVFINFTVDDAGNVSVTPGETITENVPPVKKAVPEILNMDDGGGGIFASPLNPGEMWCDGTGFQVRDLSGIKEEDLPAVKKRDYEKACKSLDEGAFYSQIDTICGKNALITMVQRSGLILKMGTDDFAQVQNMSVKTSQTGSATITKYDYPTDIIRHKGQNVALWVKWLPSEKTFSMIEKNPKMLLSTIADTITVTLEYKDGSRETVVIEVTISEGGGLGMTLREHKTEL